jgi:hypothetical protein
MQFIFDYILKTGTDKSKQRTGVLKLKRKTVAPILISEKKRKEMDEAIARKKKNDLKKEAIELRKRELYLKRKNGI